VGHSQPAAPPEVVSATKERTQVPENVEEHRPLRPERVERAVFDQTVEAIETGTTIKPYIATAI
jgi:hypothetical protein